MFDIFRIGFLNISFLDIIDIIIVAFIIYKLYNIIKGSIAAQIFVGLIFILVLSFIAQAINMKALGWMLKIISDIWVIAFIILFQPEIRRLLLIVGRSPLKGIFSGKNFQHDVADILTEAAFELSQLQHGALIIITKSTGLKTLVENGEIMNAKLSKPLLKSIFYPRSPLHDGAIVIKDDIIEAARVTLPLSSSTQVDGHNLGMRHRAGLGISEQADVLSLIVSEETGSISIAENGKLYRGLSKAALRGKLTSAISLQRSRGWKGIFESAEK
jgi:diadenylate cyclase